MKHILVILIVLLGFGFSATADQTRTWNGKEVNQKNESGKRHGYWVILGKDKPSMGYPSEGVIEEGEYDNGRKKGMWIKYYPSGNKLSEIEYDRGRPNGSFTTYYDEQDKIEEKGYWKNNVYYGEFKRFYKNGVVAQEKSFTEEGKTDGKVTYRYENGNVEYEFTTKNGVEEGEAIRYYENGDVMEKTTFGDGGKVVSRNEFAMVNPDVEKEEPKEQGPKIVGTTNGGASISDGKGITYNDNMDIEMDGVFKSGRLYTGKWYKYDEDGLLLKIEKYKEGKYIGDGIIEM